MAAGCATRRVATQPAASQPSPIAPQAKEAVVNLIRTHPGSFEGNPDADRLAKLPLEDEGDGWFAFGVVRVNPTSARYHASVGGSRGMVEYTGTIRQVDGRWVASQPDVTYFDAKP
jgi:hypothetical protein